MSRLSSLQIHSFDGAEPDGLRTQTFRVEYGPCTLIVGPNGAGKTIRGPLGITAALEGLATVPTDRRRPYVGPLPEHTAATLELDTGASLTRDLSAAKSAAAKEADQRARDLIGIPPSAWNLADFTTGTDGKRREILDAVARAGGAIESWDRARAVEEVRHELREALPDEDSAGDWWYSTLDECDDALPAADDGATWLGAAGVWASARQTERNAQQKASRSTAEELGQTAPPQVEGDARADDARADALRDERARAQIVDRTGAQKHDAEGKRLRDEVKRIEAAGHRLRPATPQVDPSYQRRIDEAQAAIDQPAVDLGPLEVALEQAQQAQQATRAAVLAARVPAATAHSEYVAAEAVASAAAADLRLIEAASDPESRCVRCGGADPLGYVSMAQGARAHSAATASRLATARVQRDATTQALTQAETAYRDAQSTTLTREAELGAQRRAQPDRALLDRALVRARDDLAAAQANRDADEKQRVDDLDQTIAAYREAATAYEEWEARPRPAVVEPDPARLAAIAAELIEISDRQDRRAARAARIEQIREAMVKADGDRESWRSTVALVAAVRAATETMASVAYRPIEQAAQRLYAGCSLPQPYFASPADFGAIVDGERLPFAGLSQSGALTTAAAIVYALAVVAKNPVRVVLLDGIEVVTEDQRPAMLAALSDAVRRGDVDTVVATMASAPGADLSAYRIDGVTLIEVEPGQHRAPITRPVAVVVDAGPVATTVATPRPIRATDLPF